MKTLTTNTNFIVIDLTLPGLEPTIYRPRAELANHYVIDVVVYLFVLYFFVDRFLILL